MNIPALKKETACCFSGYRPHKFPFEFTKNNEDYTRLESDILNAVLKSYQEGYRDFLCGGAMGFDLLCGEITLLLKLRFPEIRLACILPFEGQAESFPKSWKDRYHAVLSACDCIDYIAEEYTPRCYFARNERMVDCSSRVITYFDGKSGGTARTIAYAQRSKLEIINLSQTNSLPEQLTFFTGRK